MRLVFKSDFWEIVQPVENSRGDKLKKGSPKEKKNKWETKCDPLGREFRRKQLLKKILEAKTLDRKNVITSNLTLNGKVLCIYFMLPTK